ncbi:type IV pilus secretin PilQ [Celerinatantimonas diazotrophica]|uniref:Type IV pilus secretin PilQ/predicted competence protein n=1 Tax=Celerinatantimonas diazotrophica TaxID=412034 RepID=A0A4R1K3Y7_9GAMM|nr:type IV pilus secretin PilQ [Celerinatantimonas diazotrophica]TCK57699.1 type IV pilus secretin PilQ/predicted competence protein [Celerinatantimonas diazotrophica]CAG9298239.1 Type 3 secretion system secretin [Celerinatantimonas diazotrophica]
MENSYYWQRSTDTYQLQAQFSLCIKALVIIFLICSGFYIRSVRAQSIHGFIKQSKNHHRLELTFAPTLVHYRASVDGNQVQLWFDSAVQFQTSQLSNIRRHNRFIDTITWQPKLARLTVSLVPKVSALITKSEPPANLFITLSRRHQQHRSLQITMDVADMPAGELLLWLARQQHQSLLLKASNLPSISLSVYQQSWQQVFHWVLDICNLVARVHQHGWYVESVDALTKQEKSRLVQQKMAQRLAPLQTEFIKIRYARAAKLAKIINKAAKHIISSRSSISADERTNTIILRALASELPQLHQLVQHLDLPVREVAIASKMVTVSSQASKELGIQWQAGSARSIEQSTPDQLNINLPVPSPTTTATFKVARLGVASQLNLELSALAQENKGEIIASPQITTLDRHSAYIAQGREIPYVESAASGATSVTYKKAELSLKVTPQITPDDGIILDLLITQNNAGDEVNTSTGRAVTINTQEIKTQVLLQNGETIVLGGIYQQHKQKSVEKVPLLGDIPGIGGLFRHTSDRVQKNELLIFVTPTIMTSQKKVL